MSVTVQSTIACITQASWPATAKMGSEPMYDRPSSEFAINSVNSTLDFPGSRTTRHLDIDGLAPAPAPTPTEVKPREHHRLPRRLRRYMSSLTVKFALLIAIFLVLPLLLYSQYDKADSNLRELVIRGLQHQS